MKPLVPLAAVALAASGVGIGQIIPTAKFSQPSGYVTQPLHTNSLNIVGMNLLTGSVAAGRILEADGRILTLSDLPKVPLAPGTTYVLEIKSGDLQGVIQQISATSLDGHKLEVNDDLGNLGLRPPDRFTIRPAPTIEEIFGSHHGAISRGTDASDPLADLIWVPDDASGHQRYFIRSTDGAVCSAATGKPCPRVPLISPDGVIVQKRASPSSKIAMVGFVRETPVSILIRPGINIIGSPFAAGSTLQNLGFEKSLASAPSSKESRDADHIWLPRDSSSFDRYYFNAATSAWHCASDNKPAADALPLPDGIIIERRSSLPVNLKLSPPIVAER